MGLAEYPQSLPAELLIAMAKEEVDARAVAVQLMARRGLDAQVKWGGFEKAEQVLKVKAWS